ncbi:MAG: Hsp20/alpha crystallin family protein [Candidatus Aureabacteria bacterium]|nr:Hsp20/alpha crystallin family protein [Candidatus Auribacterota bacterium]
MSAEKKTNMLIALILLLLIIVGVQGFYLFRLYDPLSKATTHVSRTGSEVPVQTDLVGSLQNNNNRSGSQNNNHSSQKNTNRSTGFDLFMDEALMEAWNPFEEMQRMREAMDHMFQNSLGRFKSSPNYKGLLQDDFFSPDMDLKEKEDQYIVRLDIPGMDKSDINITLSDRVLSVSGRRDIQHQEKDSNQMLRQERYQGQFKRSLTLPGPVDEGKMKAQYQNGVLTIIIPKAVSPKIKKQVKIL